MDIRNKTGRPLRVPLPGGKTLFLGPGNTGQISDKAVEHPPLKKLVDAGQIEIVGEGHQHYEGPGGGGKKAPQASGPDAPTGTRHSGDR